MEDEDEEELQHDIWCSGDHNDGEECVEPEDCDPRCMGHYGVEECNPCPNPKCMAHSGNPDDPEGHEELCEELHCGGHDFEEYGRLVCLRHAAWCDPEVSDCWDDECKVKLPGGLTLRTMLADGRSEIEIEGSWGPGTAEQALAAVAGMQKGAEMLALEEAYLATVAKT